MREVGGTAFFEVGLSHVDFGLRGGKIRLILFGQAIAVSQRERLVLRRGKRDDESECG
jgi:hypothetical protein